MIWFFVSSLISPTARHLRKNCLIPRQQNKKLAEQSICERLSAALSLHYVKSINWNWFFSACLFIGEKSWVIVIALALLSACSCRHTKTLSLAHNSQTIQDIQMKLGTHVARDNMHMYSKGHNYYFNIYWVMPLFWLRNNRRALAFALRRSC